ncbi:hypothetical protein DER44DRAFT_120910 [Fusarium oxysporum]|nr:hypothetical protein DER44DRAFT_120910 [Fusarium oxysporum]
MSENSEPRAIKSRRPHRKSRNGCGNCKQRKIKCDEAKPECYNCARFDVECSYSQPRSTTPPPCSIFLVSNGPLVQRRRGRPRTRFPERNSTADEGLLMSQFSLRRMPETYRSYSVDNIEAYRLLHHYLTWTDTPAMTGSPQNNVIQVQVSLLGFTYPFLLDFIHGFSALHLAHLQPEKQRHYHAVADRFHSIGLRALASALHDIDTNNCHAIYAGSVFVCFNIFARGPLPGEYLLFSETGPAIWFQLLKGVKSILGRAGSNIPYTGPFQHLSAGPPEAYQPVSVARGLPPLDWIDHFQRLRDHVICAGDTDAMFDIEALDSLWVCYEATWGGVDGTYQGEAKNQLAFIWTYHLKDEFVLRLQSSKPVSLIIFAYFAHLLGTLEHIWFISRWPQHIICGIYSRLNDSHRPWLQWILKATNQQDEN